MEEMGCLIDCDTFKSMGTVCEIRRMREMHYQIRTQVGELIAVIPHALGTTIVAVHEGCIWFPGTPCLVFKLLATVMRLDSYLNLSVYRSLDDGGDSSHLWSKLPDILFDFRVCHTKLKRQSGRLRRGAYVYSPTIVDVLRLLNILLL
jgi:hypothetical protein